MCTFVKEVCLPLPIHVLPIEKKKMITTVKLKKKKKGREKKSVKGKKKKMKKITAVNPFTAVMSLENDQ